MRPVADRCCRTRRMIVSASLVVIAGVAHDGTTEG
jgi:hypothetical protein